MKKSLIALAALAATGAFAQSTVTIYGRAHVAYDLNYAATGATAGSASDLKNRQRVSDDGSRIGFRISEDLGGGLRAVAVIETGVNLDSATANGQSGAANSGTGFLGTREAHVGIGNAMAELRMGRQNVFWGNGPIEDVSANRISGGVIASYTSPSSGFTIVPAARMENTVQVVGGSALGQFAGSSVWIAHPNVAEQTAAGKDVYSKAQGFTLRYVNGPISAQFDHATAKNSANDPTAAADVTNAGNKLGLAYSYAAGSKVYFSNASFSTTFNLAASNNQAPTTLGSTTYAGYRKQASNSFGIQHAMGGGLELHGQYVKQGSAKDYLGANVADSGSTAYAVAARYELSKRTALTTSYNVIKNDKANNINISGGGQSSAAIIAAGSDLRVVRVSMQHQF